MGNGGGQLVKIPAVVGCVEEPAPGAVSMALRQRGMQKEHVGPAEKRGVDGGEGDRVGDEGGMGPRLVSVHPQLEALGQNLNHQRLNQWMPIHLLSHLPANKRFVKKSSK